MTGPQLILVRHGQTDSNVDKALDSCPPGPPLNALGRAQAEAAADRMATEPLAAVYASAAVRAQQTAAPIAARHNLVVQEVPGVHEVFCGDLEGCSDPDSRALFDEVYASWSAGDLTRRMPGGESAQDLLARFLPVVARLWSRHADDPDRPVVLVSHGAAIRIAAGALLGECAETTYVPNAGRVVLAPMDGAPGPAGWLLKFWEEGPPQPGDVTGGADD
jgi:probable phosphoglycerate mutase